MTTTLNTTFLPFVDSEESLTFYRDVLGFELRMDVGKGNMRWLTLGLPGQDDVSLVLEPPALDQGLSDAEREAIKSMMAKGSYARIILATDDLQGLFEKAVAAGAPVEQEPTTQPYGVRDAALRDPAGNLVRISEKGSR